GYEAKGLAYAISTTQSGQLVYQDRARLPYRVTLPLVGSPGEALAVFVHSNPGTPFPQKFFVPAQDITVTPSPLPGVSLLEFDLKESNAHMVVGVSADSSLSIFPYDPYPKLPPEIPEMPQVTLQSLNEIQIEWRAASQDV